MKLRVLKSPVRFAERFVIVRPCLHTECMSVADLQTQRPVVFITGASSGIGAAAVGVFAEAGYDVVLAARRVERLRGIASDAGRRHPGARFAAVACDVASDGSVAAAFRAAAEQFGRLDALVNNAGYGVYGAVATQPIDSFRQNFETNVFGVVRCIQSALPLLRRTAAGSKRRWGAAIVNVSSILGRRAMPMMSSYSATKFAVEALSESLRLELFDERISVTVVNPGVTKTEFQNSAEGERPGNFLASGGGMPAEAVARRILRAVRRPRRNDYLTGEGKAGLALQWLAPGVFDRILLPVWRKASAQK